MKGVRNHHSHHYDPNAWENLLEIDSVTTTEKDDATALGIQQQQQQQKQQHQKQQKHALKSRAALMSRDASIANDNHNNDDDGTVRLENRKSRPLRIGVLGLLCIASFATSNRIIDVFHLQPLVMEDTITTAATTTTIQYSMAKAPVQTERFTAIRNVVLSISSIESLTQLHTPQNKALDWIANQDTLELEPLDHRLIQRYTLAVLFFATNDMELSGWTKQFRWLTPEHECEWKDQGGVRACNPNQQVTDISLWNNLKGTLPVELGSLTKLQVLYLARNQLHGTIPTEFGKLTDLVYLGLQFNSLTGTIPAQYFGGLTNLRTLYLEKNDLTGIIKRIEPLCKLKFHARTQRPRSGQAQQTSRSTSRGKLQQFTTDCRQLVKWKNPEVTCECCTKCFAA